MRTAPGIPKWDNSARDVSAQPSPQKLLSHWPIRELGRGRGSGAGWGGAEERGVGGVGGEGRGERFSVWSCSRSARAVSPGSSRRRETFPETRAHTAHPLHTLAPRLTHAHTQPGGAGAADRSASAGTSRGAVGTNTQHSSRSGLSSWSRRRGGEGGLAQGRGAGPLAGPPCWQSRLPGRARASAESRIKRSGRERSARRMGTPLFPAL